MRQESTAIMKVCLTRSAKAVSRHVGLTLCATIAGVGFGSAAHAKAPAILYDFQGSPDGYTPDGGTYVNGVYYGITWFGGTNDDGMLYKFDLSTKTETPLYSFSYGGGTAWPTGNLLPIGTKLYGVTYWAGTAGLGSIYSLDMTTGAVQTVFSFNGNDGADPNGGLIAVHGKLYGVTASGGFQDTYGTIYSLDPKTGNETSLYQFYNTHDYYLGQPIGPLAEHNGVLYGVAEYGCAGGLGGVFQYDMKTNTETTLSCFGGADNFYPQGQTSITYANGKLYGVLTGGGANGFGEVYTIDPHTGNETIVHAFTGGADGEYPIGSLLQVGNKLYGENDVGGKHGAGSIFEIDLSSGKEKIVSSFAGNGGGAVPWGDLSFANGTLYGTTEQGGLSGNYGTIFQITLGKK